MLKLIANNGVVLAEEFEDIEERLRSSESDFYGAVKNERPAVSDPKKSGKPKKPVEKVASFRYLKTKNLYKISKCHFDANSFEAYSCDWWMVVRKINGLIVFNSYRYSNTTSRHQSKLRWLLSDLGHMINVEIEAPNGLQNIDASIRHYESLVSELEADIAKPRSRKSKNEARMVKIEKYKEKIKFIKKYLIKKVA